ncbi:uncharacterized protein CMC5_081820 [Chondromyces crocatus]|uniref:Uncharacterized protein n=1 Tax=Chondromyces crocatus TaxID=52 RepID=A0A0K1ESN4_CHOCO|nr:uncharacterized protein CMC5_081820 [Chondromyces crocatus]
MTWCRRRPTGPVHARDLMSSGVDGGLCALRSSLPSVVHHIGSRNTEASAVRRTRSTHHLPACCRQPASRSRSNLRPVVCSEMVFRETTARSPAYGIRFTARPVPGAVDAVLLTMSPCRKTNRRHLVHRRGLELPPAATRASHAVDENHDSARPWGRGDHVDCGAFQDSFAAIWMHSPHTGASLTPSHPRSRGHRVTERAMDGVVSGPSHCHVPG